MLCPNGLNSDGTFKNNNAFREAGGMNWSKLDSVYEDNYVDLGGTFWMEWRKINPSDGVYDWSAIDNIVNGAKSMTMDTPNGVQGKGVVIRLYTSASERPAKNFIPNTEAGFIFGDYTPQYVKSRLQENIPWGGILKLDGTRITKDDGSYWIKMPCVYRDYQDAKVQGSNWNYSVWVMPKYDRSEWLRAAEKALVDIGRHYEGSDVVFLLGLLGMDGEYGNYIQNSFAGCGNLREAFAAQYRVSSNNLHFTDMTKFWRMGAPTVKTFVSCTSDCDPNWFVNYDVGLFQARAVDDGPNYHRVGDIGALDWAIRFNEMGKPVAWENAYTLAEDRYMYKMISVIMQSWPEWFSFVGASWDNEKIINMFLPYFGRSISTTNEIWFQSYWSCFAYPDFIDCPDTDLDSSNYNQYSGWLRNIEVGITTTNQLDFVNPWTELTAEQQKGLWWKMLRKITTKLDLAIDQRWGGYNKKEFNVNISYLDTGSGTAQLVYYKTDGSVARVNIDRLDNKLYNTKTFSIFDCDLSRGISISVTGSPLFFHKLAIVM
jgi:hypothetical protein